MSERILGQYSLSAPSENIKTSGQRTIKKSFYLFLQCYIGLMDQNFMHRKFCGDINPF